MLQAPGEGLSSSCLLALENHTDGLWLSTTRSTHQRVLVRRCIGGEWRHIWYHVESLFDFNIPRKNLATVLEGGKRLSEIKWFRKAHF